MGLIMAELYILNVLHSDVVMIMVIKAQILELTIWQYAATLTERTSAVNP